ncbi:GNAT family N-acetyltransferase [Shewanella sp. YIC-542]|uniref:GNAT family N-acetyltransferase n=1 Tax=Shewanella mytili TaxID=3377111 RepID=UPI00398EB2EC
MQWQLQRFSKLDNHTLYHLLKLRVDVFVVEQQCPYPELDDKDHAMGAMHLLGYGNDGELQAYARLLPPGCSYAQCSIGRVLVAASARGQGLGTLLMQQAVMACHGLWPDSAIRIGAQHHLQQFYASLGFAVVSAVYLEDGIAHVQMQLPPPREHTDSGA